MSAAEDAKTIRNAIKGLGTDDAKLVGVITKRTNEQLVSITAEYMSQFGKSIFDDIKGDTSGNYRDLLVALVEAKPIFIARTIHSAVKGAGTNENALIDAIVHQPNALIRAATDQYHKLFGKTAHDDVAGDTSGDFKRLCVGLLAGTRDESPVVNAALVQTDAENLYKKGEGRLGTDEEAFIEFFLNRSYAHIAEVDKAYAAKRGHGLVAAINGEFSGNTRKALKALALSRSEFWAYRIHQSLEGLGTNDSALIRAFVLNTRDQLKGIDAAYTARLDRKKSGKKSEKSGKEKKDKKDKKDKKKTVTGSLRADITGDTSGWYEKSLLSLLA